MGNASAADMAEKKFVSLTTFKRDGSPVASPMWIAADGGHLVVWTPADTWKVKRARRDPRIELRPCGRTGKVDADAPVLTGTAEVVTDSDYVTHVATVVKEKYGLEFTVITFAERLFAHGRKPRVALRITPAA